MPYSSENHEALMARNADSGDWPDRPTLYEIEVGGPWGTLIEDLTPDEAWALAYAKAEQAGGER